MIDSQLRPTGVNDPRVLEALRSVPRELFVPAERRLFAYIDEDQEVAPGRYLSEPMIFARLLNEVRVRAEDRVLLVGAATGYGAAVIGRLAAHTVALEEDEALAAQARANLAALGVGDVAVEVGPLTAGWPSGAPYDVLFVDGAVEFIPQPLIEQLREGARLAAVIVEPSGVGRATVGTVAGGAYGANAFADAAMPLLPGFRRPAGFRF